MSKFDDRRSPEAAAYRVLYRGKRWQELRKLVIARDRYVCQRCNVFVVQGKKSPKSAVVHHVTAHKGNTDLFYDMRNLQLVCRACHDGALQSAEARGYDSTIGEDGWPIDAKHPQHMPRIKAQFSGHMPPDFTMPSVPCVLVCGPPAAGKTTYVRGNAGDGDTTIDLDDYKEQVGGTRWDGDANILGKAIVARDRALSRAHLQQAGALWVIITGTHADERKAWAKALGGAEIVIIATPAKLCGRRIMGDRNRKPVWAEQMRAVDRWHKANPRAVYKPHT